MVVGIESTCNGTGKKCVLKFKRQKALRQKGELTKLTWYSGTTNADYDTLSEDGKWNAGGC